MPRNGPLSPADAERLQALLDGLIPAEPPWPGGATVADAVVADALADQDVPTLRTVLDALPAGFAGMTGSARAQAISAVERALTGPFQQVLHHTYNAYYAAGPVRDVIAAETRYPNRPPLYEGYELPPFDPGLLEKQRQRAPFWRKA